MTVPVQSRAEQSWGDRRVRRDRTQLSELHLSHHLSHHLTHHRSTWSCRRTTFHTPPSRTRRTWRTRPAPTTTTSPPRSAWTSWSSSGSWRRQTGEADVVVVFVFFVGGGGLDGSDDDDGNVNIIVNICQHYFNTVIAIVSPHSPVSRQDEIFSHCILNYPGNILI